MFEVVVSLDKRPLRLAIEGAVCQSCLGPVRSVLSEKLSAHHVVIQTLTTTACTLEIDSDIQIHHIVDQINQNDYGYQFTWVENQLVIPAVIDQSPPYFRKALINGLFALPLMIISFLSLMPSPLTLIGQIMGLGLSVGTAALMYYSGKEYYQSAYRALKAKTTNMNTLVALSTLTAWIYSVGLWLVPQLFPITALHYHFAEVGMILGIINVGRGIRAKAEYAVEKQMQDRLAIFKKYQPEYAWRVKPDNTLEKIHYEDIQVGDILEIKAGERFPVEGQIVSQGVFFVNQKNITGEPQDVKKSIGDSVLTGTLNKTRAVQIKASVSGPKNNLMKLLSHLQIAQDSRAAGFKHSQIIDKITKYFIPAIIGIAVVTGLSWLWVAPAGVYLIPVMIQSVMSVLLCACPCTLGLAAPMSMALATHKLLAEGILVKNAASFEEADRIDTIIFDKTGTLTEPVVASEYFPDTQWPKDKILPYVVDLEKQNDRSHPIARVISDYYVNTDVNIVENAITQEQGMTGVIKGDARMPIILGSLDYCLQKQSQISLNYTNKFDQITKLGHTAVFVIVDLQCVGLLALQHDLNPQSKKQIAQLKAMGIKIGLLTGDKKEPAEKIARQLEIDLSYVYYEKTADQKREIIQSLKKTRQGVAMVGDGMNDITACAQADVGFAIHAWTNAAAECDVALKGSVGDIAKFLVAAKAVRKNIKQNLAWTFLYNTIALLGATGLLYPILSCAMSPIIASLAMAGSSLFVIMNAKRLPGLLEQAWRDFVGEPSSDHQEPACFRRCELREPHKIKQHLLIRHPAARQRDPAKRLSKCIFKHNFYDPTNRSPPTRG